MQTEHQLKEKEKNYILYLKYLGSLRLAKKQTNKKPETLLCSEKYSISIDDYHPDKIAILQSQLQPPGRADVRALVFILYSCTQKAIGELMNIMLMQGLL